MSFNIGLCSVSFRSHTPEEILAAAKRAGLSYIEWGSDVHAPHSDERRLCEIVALQEKYGIKCSSYGTYFRLGVTPLGELEDYVNAAKKLGTSIVRVWCGSKNSEDYTSDEKKALFDACRAAAEIAKKHSVTLCTECHNNTYTNCTSGALELFDAVKSEHFRTYWQPNQYRSEEENIICARLLAPLCENVHVFNWKGDERYPLCDAVDIWKKYLSHFERGVLLLEFMPDDKIDALENETIALKEIIR